MFIIQKDKDGWLYWQRWTGFSNKVHCPFNKKMQCNANCPLLTYKESDYIVEFNCTGVMTAKFNDTKVVNK